MAAGPARLIAPIAATICAMAAFQVGAAFAKGLFPAVGPQGAATQRIVLGALMLVVITRPWRGWPQKAPWAPMLGLGFCIAGVISFFYAAMERLPLGVVISLQFLGPLTVAVVASRKVSHLVWAILAAGGVWSLIGTLPSADVLDPVGVLLALGAAACWGGYIVLGRMAGAGFGGATAAVAMSIAAIFVLPLGVMEAGTALLRLDILPLALMVAAFSTALPLLLELFAMARLPARTFAVFLSLEPAFGALSGLWILGERLTALQSLGVALVVLAAAGSTWSSTDSGRAPKAADAATT